MTLGKTENSERAALCVMREKIMRSEKMFPLMKVGEQRYEAEAQQGASPASTSTLHDF